MSAHLSKIHSKDTKQELKLRQLLHGAGYIFRIHLKDIAQVPRSLDLACDQGRWAQGAQVLGPDHQLAARRDGLIPREYQGTVP
ncbi:hypothetical protein [Arthrobacter sp. FB24]|uniref:hypothetical protein n=1 Tax=Arthrobacter sp. (strain FB24) TaxID=290399 RepID=UPI000A03C8A1